MAAICSSCYNNILNFLVPCSKSYLVCPTSTPDLIGFICFTYTSLDVSPDKWINS